jgi:hypothetical protein
MAYTDASLKRANMRPANGCELAVLHMYAALRCHQAFCSSYTLLPSLKAVVYGTAHLYELSIKPKSCPVSHSRLSDALTVTAVFPRRVLG